MTEEELRRKIGSAKTSYDTLSRFYGAAGRPSNNLQVASDVLIDLLMREYIRSYSSRVGEMVLNKCNKEDIGGCDSEEHY